MFPILHNWQSIRKIAEYGLLIPVLIIKTLGWKWLTILALATVVPAVITRYRKNP
jgi:hypothetical protein